MAKRIDALLADYASYHQARGNKICHFIGIPLITYSFLAILQLARVGPITGAEILIGLTTVYYLSLEVRFAAGMLLAAAGLDLIAVAISNVAAGFAALVVGWVFQAIGHAVYERNRPAFFRNLGHLLIGPLFLINELLHIRPIVARQSPA